MIVLGLGFGDEGKGQTVSYLCSQVKNPIVVRFNGGHQAGHTVIKGDKRHVFSNFGSGTLDGVPTYWSKYCTFHPVGWMNEYLALEKLGIQFLSGGLQFYIHPLAPVVTPLDIEYNRYIETINNHGSCGVGFGATIERNEKHVKLYVQDLRNETILRKRIDTIVGYYNQKGFNWHSRESLEKFFEATRFCMSHLQALPEIRDKRYYAIYEGAQGIMLDKDFGFFPHVTRSNTTSKNALSIAVDHSLSNNYEEIMYVTRCYQTRHGNGPMTTENSCPPLINNEKETNRPNRYQGKFRTGMLDIDLINYAIDCDSLSGSKWRKRHLMITCADQMPDEFNVSVGSIVKTIKPQEIHKLIHHSFETVTISYGDKGYIKLPQG